MPLGYQTGTGARPSDVAGYSEITVRRPRARGHVGERLVDLGERAARRDHAFEVEPTGAPQVEQARDVAAAVAAAEETSP